MQYVMFDKIMYIVKIVSRFIFGTKRGCNFDGNFSIKIVQKIGEKIVEKQGKIYAKNQKNIFLKIEQKIMQKIEQKIEQKD